MAGIEKTHTSKLQIMQKPNEWIDVLSRASCKNTSSILIPTDHVWLFSWFIFACACFTVESNAAGASRRTAHNSAIDPLGWKSRGGNRAAAVMCSGERMSKVECNITSCLP